MNPPLGFSGRFARFFLFSRLTPLLAILGLLLGGLAALVTPREEEPQIDVTMANLFIPLRGARVADVEHLVVMPMEQILAEIEGVKHIYSASTPGLAVLTVQFEVGVPRSEALVRLYNAVHSHADWRPATLGAGPVLIKPMGIDDVPILALTLWSDDPLRDGFDLRQIALALETELQRVPGTRNVETLGGDQQVVRVFLDPQRLAAHGLSVLELRRALHSSNRAEHSSGLVADNRYLPVQAGEYLSSPQQLAELVVGVRDGGPVYLEDVADLSAGPEEHVQYTWFSDRQARWLPAVTLAISKKPGENAATVAEQILRRLETLKTSHIPEGVSLSVTRNYGETADAKAQQLIQKLMFATLSVVGLVLIALGWRAALVVGAAVVLTLLLTLFASWAWGFTLNRVSLFALIFAIGILVDDAIVVVESIHRQLSTAVGSLTELIPAAVDEVGGPTILATLTVIAALLPMAFVTGLMGPYMSPIPINASLGMLISLLIAFSVTPWLSARLQQGDTHQEKGSGWSRWIGAAIRPFLGARGRGYRLLLGGVLVGLILLALSLVGARWVVLKMLPFDNKSEFQVVVDLPEGSALERTNALLGELNDRLFELAEVDNIQAYAGGHAPISFNGLVRQYYLRQAPHQGDLQVNLQPRNERQRSSHELAQAARVSLREIAARYGARIKIVEVPPGPPVMAPVVAEIYGPDYAGQAALARKVQQQFEAAADLVDVDDSLDHPAERLVVTVDRSRAALLGVPVEELVETISGALQGADVTYLHTGHAKEPVPVRLGLAEPDKARADNWLSFKVRAAEGQLVAASELVSIRAEPWEQSIQHKDLLPVVYVTADMGGGVDSPLYGMFEQVAQLDNQLAQFFVRQPETPFDYSIKWDGEWQITYETFRDMGIAYSAGLLLIYLLVVAQFASYSTPLVIMAPIPLTLIGILPGHALLGAPFTATSMIGMIALAGIIVRNSILLVDYINQSIERGDALETAVVEAACVRAKPIVLTALAAMLGAFFILDDPIFNGLAVSLIAGLFVSTLLTLLVIPLLYYCLVQWQGRAIVSGGGPSNAL